MVAGGGGADCGAGFTVVGAAAVGIADVVGIAVVEGADVVVGARPSLV